MRTCISRNVCVHSYHTQLEILHSMGIFDDAASLHYLEDNGGDIEATLERIYETSMYEYKKINRNHMA